MRGRLNQAGKKRRVQASSRERISQVGHRPPFDCIALLLQGGGALGAYQAGVYEALAEADLRPDWVAGTSIGAINSAIIAGTTREERVGKLREFWELVSRSPFGFDTDFAHLLSGGDAARRFARQTSAVTATVVGVPGFYVPRIPGTLLQPPSTLEAMSFYDTTLLKTTLERLVDFDLINSKGHDVRLSLGTVNVQSGQLVLHNGYHPRRARYGKRRADAMVSRSRNRRRILLGRRHRFEYALGMAC
jgi:NTE family protein